VIGRPPGYGPDVQALEQDLELEQAQYGDLFRLDMVENMNEGKFIMWAREVGRGRAGERDALWVFKVDDDVRLMPIETIGMRLSSETDHCRCASTARHPCPLRPVPAYIFRQPHTASDVQTLLHGWRISWLFVWCIEDVGSSEPA
jgi:hypothetical protein